MLKLIPKCSQYQGMMLGRSFLFIPKAPGQRGFHLFSRNSEPEQHISSLEIFPAVHSRFIY